MNYRDVLYSNYSANFGGHKRYDPESQYAVYRPMYGPYLPEDHAIPIADVGCGKGEWLVWLKDLAYSDLTGIDVAASELKDLEGTEGIDTIDGVGTEVLHKHENRFQLIHAKDLIEHLDKNEIVDFLQVCLSALQPGGEIWLSTFNGQSQLASMVHHGDFTHETALTPTSMAQVLRAVGFDDVRVNGTFITPATTNGRIRSCMFPLLEMWHRLRTRILAGKPVPIEGVEVDSCKPGIFGRARRPL